MEPIGVTSALLAVFVSVLWGGNIVSIRIGLDSVPSIWSAFWRMLLGVLFVGVWAWSSRVSLKPAPGETGPLLGLGVLFTVQIALLNIASELTSPAYGVVILNSYAIFVNLVGHAAARIWKGAIAEEAITPLRAIGLALAIAGMMWLGLGRPDAKLAPDPLLGNLLMAGSSFLLGVRHVYLRWLVRTVHPVQAVVWQMLISVPLFLVVAALTQAPVAGRLSWQAVAAIAYQGIVVAGFCFIVWTKLLKRHAAGTLTMFAFLVPICGILASAVIFGEELRWSLAGGTVLVLAGVFIVVFGPNSAASRA